METGDYHFFGSSKDIQTIVDTIQFLSFLAGDSDNAMIINYPERNEFDSIILLFNKHGDRIQGMAIKDGLYTNFYTDKNNVIDWENKTLSYSVFLGLAGKYFRQTLDKKYKEISND
jgi:hypothetical protein